MMEVPKVNLTLPFPPYTNNMFVTLMLKGKPVRVPSGQAKKYKTAVKKLVQHLKPFTGEVRVDLKVYRPRRVGDLDGTFKAVFDSLTSFAWNDDKQITQIHAERFDDRYNPRVEITIQEVASEETLFKM